MYEIIALITLLVWPLVPAFLLTLHPVIGFWRKIGAAYYVVPISIWAAVAYLIYTNKAALLKYSVYAGALFLPGAIAMAVGMILHAWASALIGIKGTIGWYELFPPKDSKFIVAGPYKYVRHPIYLAHSFIFFGAFFMTGALSAGAVAVLDFALSYFVITRIEEKELRERFGKEYEDYAKKVPKFFPAPQRRIPI